MIRVSIQAKQLKTAKKRVRKEIEKVIPKNLHSATVGLHNDTGLHFKRNSNILIGVPLVGIYGHFGTITQPPRPWLDKGFIKSIPQIKKIFYSTAKAGANLNFALEASVKIATRSIQKYVWDLKVPENAPETIARKGFDDPLIHTEQMVNSIDYKIYNRGEPSDL